MRVLLSAGEASGDLYGSALISELRRLDSTIELCGLGGARMRAEGFDALGDSSSWGSISILQSLREGLRALGTHQRLKKAFSTGEKGIFLPIDFGYMNLRLAKAAKEAGWKVVYFVPPGSWRRDRQGKDIPEVTDHVVTNFPWSADILNRMGANAHFFGHPLKQIHRDLLQRPHQRSGIAVLPGSRRSELEQLLPILSGALQDETQVATLPVPSHFRDYVDSRWSRQQDQIVDGSLKGAVISALVSSESGVICSGTATLEATLARTPMVAVYRVSKAVEIEAKLVRFKRPQFVSQPNILLQREVVPELIQEGLTVESLKRTLSSLADQSEIRKQQAGFDEINTLLGAEDAITRTAELILSLS
jgi:lipid-A-disaccharide synthase